MAKKLPVFLDGPDKQTIGVSIIFSALCFFSLPFLLLLWTGGYWDNMVAISWFEVVFHVITFLITLGLFREFLQEGWDAVRFGRQEVLHYVKIAAGINLGIVLTYYLIHTFFPNVLTYVFAFGTLPVSEMNLFMLPSESVLYNPFFCTPVLVLLVPVTTSCLYYAVGFIHTQNVRPWLGYLVVAVVIALPRVANAMTYWAPADQCLIYLAQLPVHLVACWSLRKTNTIWAPIFVHMASNLLASLLLIFTYLL